MKKDLNNFIRTYFLILTCLIILIIIINNQIKTKLDQIISFDVSKNIEEKEEILSILFTIFADSYQKHSMLSLNINTDTYKNVNQWLYFNLNEEVELAYSNKDIELIKIKNPQGDIIGIAILEKNLKEIYIRQFAILKEWKRRGIGSSTMKYIIRNYGENITLCVRTINIEAINFYHKCNFTLPIKCKVGLSDLNYKCFAFNKLHK